MKRCPVCRRDYTDETLNFCLDDGSALLEGPASADAPMTAIRTQPRAEAAGAPASESPTRRQLHTTDETAIFPSEAEAKPQSDSDGVSKLPVFGHKKRATVPQGKKNKLLAIFG